MIRILSFNFVIIAASLINCCDGFAAAIAAAKAATGNSFGSAIGSAIGGNQASASASVLATNNFVSSTATASASGGGRYHPAPYYPSNPKPAPYYPSNPKPVPYHPKPAPYQPKPTPYHPKPAPYYPKPVYYPQPSKYHPAPVVVVTKPSRKVYVDYKKCGDMKNCYDMDHYSNCGYCQETHYGYGCDYDIVHGTEYVPKCSCKGRFIYKKSDCY